MVLLWSSVDTWTYDDTNGLAMLVVFFVVFLLRDTSPLLRTVWDIMKLIIFVILVITTAGLAIKWLKKIF
jgi:hypothetical protein